MKNKIICVHLFNDYSGSPRVLSTAIKNMVAEGQKVEIMTSREGEGFLSKIEGVSYQTFSYQFHENKLARLRMFLWAQVVLFFQVWKSRGESRTIYVNTLLPFGAAIAGRLAGIRVIYHLHETTVNPPLLKSFLKKVAQVCASEAIYVSHFLQEREPLKGVPSRVIHNCLSADFSEKSANYLRKRHEKFGPFTVLMLCSLKGYKGVNKYVNLAKAFPELRFLLVLNASYEAVQAHFAVESAPENLVIFPAQKNVHSFYQEADLVMNLSHPEQWVETFGMTLLEGMSYSLPVIAPPVGGPAELIEDGLNGFKIDQRNQEELEACLRNLSENSMLYQQLSANALKSAKVFSEQHFRKKIFQAINGQEEFVRTQTTGNSMTMT